MSSTKQIGLVPPNRPSQLATREAKQSQPDTRCQGQGGRPCVDGKFLTVAGRRFWIKGVTYGTFRANSRGELLPEPEVVRRDMRQMRAAGVNTVRTYTLPPR